MHGVGLVHWTVIGLLKTCEKLNKNRRQYMKTAQFLKEEQKNNEVLAASTTVFPMCRLHLFLHQVLADQDWISFRPNVFALQDLASKWIETIKARLAEAQRADTVTEHVHQVRNVVAPNSAFPAEPPSTGADQSIPSSLLPVYPQ